MKINIELKYGIYLGIAMCLYTVFMWLTKLDTEYLSTGQYLDIAVILLPVTFTFLAVWKKSKTTELTVAKRIQCGLVVNFVSYLIYKPFLVIYHNFINPDWIKYVLELKEKELKAQNIASEQVNEALNRISSASNDFNFVGVLIGVLIFGLIFSLLTIPFIKSKTNLNGQI